MKLSVSAYRAHASAHKKILSTSYQLNYGSTSASLHPHSAASACPPGFKIDPLGREDGGREVMSPGVGDASSDDANTPLQSPRSINTSREEDDSSNANESDCKSPSQRTKSNQRWMKLRTTVQISSAIQSKKPPLKREDSFLKRFSTRQIPETQETVEDTGSEGAPGDNQAAPRRRRRPQRHPRSVVNPDENFYFYWLLVLTVCVLYNLWTLIVRQSFPELQALVSSFWYTCDAVSDLVFLFDVGVQLRTGYLEQGLMVYDSKKLAGHYLHSRAFLLDLGALTPLDLLQLRFGAQPLLRFPRFLKVYRAVNYYYMVESRTVWPNLWRVVNLIHILLILAHWFGCFYFLLSEAEGFQGDWVYPYRPGDYATLTRKYLGSLYWSTLTLTTIGDLPTPETNAEKTQSVDGPRSLPRRGLKSRLLQFNTSGGYVFTIVSYLIGVFIFATIVGQVGNVITNRNANRLEFERLLDGAKTYMRHHKVPGGMKRRVLRWYDYSWSRGRIQGGGDINTALGLLPDKLKTELALHVNLSVLKKVTIFQECQPEFLHDLVLKMKAYIFTPGDSICRKGEVAREMFIIADGILEVLSETGKVLTTMKAGDFFGEIGILNLDGLNKRTADVRSVGYSELFSLSREDVLMAMKDYPEAQEILQALGRKRLMDIRNSSRLAQQQKDHHHHHHHHGGGHHLPDPKGLVDKIKNEAKGLRNVLRKSRTHRRSQESLELQPLHTRDNGSSTAKGVLRRMPRVRSHDLSQEDTKEEASEPPPAVTSPLGAGLPLLSRLRLLKEKQDHEEKQANVCTTPLVKSPSPASVKSPPPVPEETTEVLGAGLPLLQRLLLLKNKDKDKETGGDQSCSLVSPTPSPKPPANRLSFKGRLKTLQAAAQPPPSILSVSETIKESASETASERCEQPWIKLKKAAIGGPPERTAAAPPAKRPKPSPLSFPNRTKDYNSVDDLSPEYCGLPFVKKLKILNERQKLAELEYVMKTRSVSLDIPEQTTLECETLTRSHSEGCAMHHANRASPNHSSPESNETQERRNLKSILKKLSEDTQQQLAAVAAPAAVEKSDSTEFRRLMRAPTIEGYAARHSKLSKSVTFNRDTLQSPPNSANLLGGQQNLFTIPVVDDADVVAVQEDDVVGEEDVVVVDDDDDDDDDVRLESCGIQIISAKTNPMKLLRASGGGGGGEEEQYFSDVLLAIKQVMGAHLQDIQDKFQERFELLQMEVKNRDQIIDDLKTHILELEKVAEDSYTDSMETVVSRDLHSWDDHSTRDSLQDLPRPMSPQHVWASSQQSPSVVLDMDSNTDTESELEDSSEPGYESGEFENSHNNWEVEMLAAQMRQRRSASLDQQVHLLPRAPRRRFSRGASVDNQRD